MEKSPLFVKVEEYDKILDVVDKIKERISSVHETLEEVKHLRDQEANALAEWEIGAAQVQKRLAQVDKILFEPETK